jgi:MinD-like ATPase involved in chromosome partitioning or flagellar assembly
MKILTVNPNGNVGKSFLTRELFIPYVNKGQGILYETVGTCSGLNNIQDFYPDLKVFKTDFTDFTDSMEFYQQLIFNDNFIADIDATTFNDFTKMFEYFFPDIIFSQFDYVIVPTLFDVKSLNDTLITISYLRKELNVSPKKIKVIINRLTDEVLKTDKYDNIFQEFYERLFVNLAIPKKNFEDLYLKDFPLIKHFENRGLHLFKLAKSKTNFLKKAKKLHKKALKEYYRVKHARDTEEDEDFRDCLENEYDAYLKHQNKADEYAILHMLRNYAKNVSKELLILKERMF